MSDINLKQKTRWPLFRARSLQFMYFFAAGAAIPYFPMYYYTVFRDSSGQALSGLIGLIMFLQTLMGIFAPPLAGIISDKLRIHRRMLSACALVAGLSAFVISIPGFVKTPVATPGIVVLLVTAAVLHGLSVKPLMPLIDTECLNDLRQYRGETSRYGSIRQFGSIAWTASAILGGTLLYYTWIPNAAVLVYATGFIILGLITLRGIKARVKKVVIPWHELIHDKRFFLFLFFIFVSALAIASSYAYTSVYMKEQQLSTVFIGITIGVSALIEVPFFFNAPRFLRLIGDKWMMVIGTLLEMLKMLLFSLMDSGTPLILFILVQMLHGLGYSVFFAGAIHFMDARSHEHLKATYQSLYHMMWAGGGALGSFIIPLLIASRGSAYMMGVFALIMLGGSIFAAIVFKNSKTKVS